MVSLSSPAGAPVSVDYSTADGTATGGLDYTVTSGSAANGTALVFPAGMTSEVISVPVLPDNLVEPDETFTLNLLPNPVNATINSAIDTATGVPPSAPAPAPFTMHRP